MHPEIARWPSYHFYGDRLKNGPQKRTSSFLRPYALLDSHRIGKETKKGSLSYGNHGEASFIGRYAENNSFIPACVMFTGWPICFGKEIHAVWFIRDED